MSRCVPTIAEQFADGRIRWRCPCGLSGITPHTIDKVHLPDRCRRIDLTKIPQPAQPCGGCHQRQEALNNIIPGAGDAVAVLAKPIAKAIDAMAGTNIAGRRPTLLIRFPHGLGDCVQLSVVLRHIRGLHPEWDVDVQVKGGRGRMLRHLTRRQYELPQEPVGLYDIDQSLPFHEPGDSFADCPSTKAEHAIKQFFPGLVVDSTLCRYSITWGDEESDYAERFIAERQLGPFACVHYQGNSLKQRKNLDESGVVRPTIDAIAAAGLTPLVIDLDNRSRLPLLERQFVRDFPRDGAFLAALLSRSRFNLGIDSGLGHLMNAQELAGVPAVVAWTGHHAVNYMPPEQHVLHVLRVGHESLIRGNHKAGLAYFQAHYRHAVAQRHYRYDLPEIVRKELACIRRLAS